MFLPTTSGALTLLAILAVLALGMWPLAGRLTGKGWRGELTYYDLLLGAFAAALLLTLTAGSLNTAELTSADNLSIVGYRKAAFAMAGGAVLGLGLTLLFNAGIWTSHAAAFLAGGGIAAAVPAIRTALNLKAGMFWVVAALALLGAVVALAAVMVQGGAAPGRTPPPVSNDPRARRPRVSKPPTGAFAALFAILGGVCAGLFPFFTNEARAGEIGLGPYPIVLALAAGVLFAGLLVNPFLLNFPIAGDAMVVRDYFRRGPHLVGAAAGFVLGAGWLALFLVWAAPPQLHQPRWEWVVRFAPPVVTAVAGLALGELGRAPKARLPLLAALVLVAAAIGLGFAIL